MNKKLTFQSLIVGLIMSFSLVNSDFINNEASANQYKIFQHLTEFVFKPSGMKLTKALAEAESKEYGSYRFFLNHHSIVFRSAKTTPKKIGQFVTLWKRPKTEIQPLHCNDDINYVMVYASDETHEGLFVFDRETLIEKGIMECDKKKGKLAIRVYPPWTTPEVKDAIKSQKWQINSFFPISKNTDSNAKKLNEFF